jgi:hypothetical protein
MLGNTISFLRSIVLFFLSARTNTRHADAKYKKCTEKFKKHTKNAKNDISVPLRHIARSLARGTQQSDGWSRIPWLPGIAGLALFAPRTAVQGDHGLAVKTMFRFNPSSPNKDECCGRGWLPRIRVCVYYCSTYYKAARVGGGGVSSD